MSTLVLSDSLSLESNNDNKLGTALTPVRLAREYVSRKTTEESFEVLEEMRYLHLIWVMLV